MIWRQKGIAFLSVLAILVTACSGSPAATSPSAAAATAAPTEDAFTAQWKDLIAAAQKEGALSLVGGPEGSQQDGPWYDAFGKQFGIKVTLTGGATNDIVTRTLAERAQNLYTIDIAGLGGTGTDRFIQSKIIEPFAPFIINPEAKDRSKGFAVDHAIYSDTEGQFCQYVAVQGIPNLGDFFYNTAKVTPAELDSLKSYKDLLDPKWKGRIVIGDIASGEASRDRTVAWLKLGQSWFDALLRQQAPHVAIYGDERFYADGVARGDFHIAIFPPGAASLDSAAQQGLPVKYLDRTLAEGAIKLGIQRVCVMNKAPHPNAAKLFANWALMKDGQTALNQFTNRLDRASLRTDVPQGKIANTVWTYAHNNGAIVDDSSKDYTAAVDASAKYLKATFAELKITPGR